MKRVGLVVLAIAAAGLSLGAGNPPDDAIVCTKYTDVASSHELRGIAAVRVTIDIPESFENPDVSQAGLMDSITRQFQKSGLEVVTGYSAEVPHLYISILPIRGDSQNFYFIVGELQESCKVSRSDGIDVKFCKTWSTSPHGGFFDDRDVSGLIGQVRTISDQFLNAWSFDNPSRKK